LTKLPTGTVTFLFTDIEGSTRLWEACPDAMPDVIARHDAILLDAIAAHAGTVIGEMGDGMAAVFFSGADAVAAAVDAQRAIGAESWGVGSLRVRMGIHTDDAQLRSAAQYVNRPLNRCARVMGVAHGGQTLVTEATAAVVADVLPADVGLVELGEHRLRDLARSVRLFQVMHPELPRDFPPLRSLDLLPSNLPLQLTELVGRADEVLHVKEVLASGRVVTLTGVGGIGKTRLALQVAADVLPHYPDGAWLCELGSLTDSDALVETVALALGVRAGVGTVISDALFDFLRCKELLIILDNCEHLLGAAAGLVDRIGGNAPM
jgi:class 3 adenylate cyclase